MSLIAADSPLRKLRHQKRFVNERLRVLLLRDRYHVQEECRDVLKAMGHEVIDIWLGQNPTPSQMLQAVLNATAVWQPDFLLSINAFGFDRAHWMGEALEAVGLPVAIWLVDSPTLILRGWLPLGRDRVHLFVWDRSYIPYLRRLGAEHVYHLPLAASRQRRADEATQGSHRYHLSFVGGSLHHGPQAWAQHLSTQAIEQAKLWVPKLKANPQILHDLARQPGLPVCEQVMIQGWAQAEVSRMRRYDALCQLDQSQLHVFGDSGWKLALPTAQHHDQIAYGSPLDHVYQASTLCLNVTSAQMPDGVNQRLFDVPQAGGFLLTDHQPELSDYFVPGAEVISYNSPDELADKAAYYQKRPEQRADIIRRAQARIEKEHLFTHRIQKIVDTMRLASQPRPSLLYRQAPEKNI